MTDLISKLEAAAEGSRELDKEIWKACGSHISTIGTERWPNRIGEVSHFISIECPDYTTSIDAALVLVPEGWCWVAGNELENFASVKPDHNAHDKILSSSSATPALALCIAALKARA